MKLITRVASTALLTLPLAACSVIGGAAPEPPQCSTTYDLRAPTATLGSDEAFENAVHAALTAGAPTTLADVTASAGWSGTWDRVVLIKVGMPPEYVAEIAGTPSACWVGVPPLARQESSRGYYAFLAGDEMVQSVYWESADGDVLGYVGTPVLHPDTPLTVDPVPGRLTPVQ